MHIKTLLGAVALSFAGFAASAATVNTIDFTTATALPVAGLTVTGVPVAPNFNQTYDGEGTLAACAANGGPLACVRDGLGVRGDEVTAPRESITVTFTSAVKVLGVHVLDLFKNQEGDFEGAQVVAFGADGSELGTFSVLGAMIRAAGSTSGYNYIDVGVTGVKSLVFTAFGVCPSGCDDLDSDTSLAGIDVVPLPAAGIMLLTAFGGLGAMSLRNRRKNA